MDKRWFQLTTEETLQELSSRRSGLTEEEAKSRLREYGPNELQRRKKTPRIVAFLRQFLSPLIYVLLLAAGISLAVEHYIDAGVIMGVLLLNAIIGYMQQRSVTHRFHRDLGRWVPFHFTHPTLFQLLRVQVTLSTLTAQTFSSGILATGSRTGFVSKLAALSAK